MPDADAQTSEAEMAGMVDSTGADRTVNNVMRHAYRVLSDEEKDEMQAVKDLGLKFHELLGVIGNSREISLAKTKIEEAVMWAVKHITA
ncbi:Acb2/Tad1 domain-containing protein [Sphingopyxis terrae]|uniref:Acb2/Tad1 domain-containing protein n=1 Tax=Sphingopyxis terrae TaxID=33052 RepID=UPI003F8121AA